LLCTTQQHWIKCHGNEIAHLRPSSPSPRHHHTVGSWGRHPPHGHVSVVQSPKADCERICSCRNITIIDLVRCELQTRLG
jgi:hypothetical protein